MKKSFLAVTIGLAVFHLSAQNIALDGGVTHAVVVGISDYQDKDIPDLRFADKDAEAFANFLRSPAGGSLDGDHLKVLLNSEATVAQFAIALDWLMENSKEGDNAIIYFSGHGDVEKKTITQPGFLLCWDAPSRVYMAGGAFNLRDVQEIVSTLSIQNKAKVVVITDACRSGTLAGQSIGGAQATAANLAKQYANEIKILSCQPSEYSIEGEQWGGGRGAFSFNLVNALYGLADQNNDLFVSLREVGRYLEDHVSTEVAPVSQNPKVVGDPNERLATVNPQLLADLRSGKTNQMKLLSPIESRGLEKEVLATVDTTVREIYRMFKKALKDKIFLEPIEACAEAYYERLMAEPKMKRLHSAITRNYAAALQDDAQQVMNTMLKSGLTEEVRLAAKASVLYAQYPRYLQRAAELLGEGHYMYAPLRARQQFFEGKMAATTVEKRQAYHRALHWQPDMPHALAEMIRTFKAEQTDSADLYFSQAAAQAPEWVAPYLFLSNFYEQKAKQPDKAAELLNRAGHVDSASVLVWYWKAKFFQNLKNYQDAEHWYGKAIVSAGTDICFPCAYNNLGTLYRETRRYAEAEAAYKKAIQLDSAFARACENLGNVYDATRRYSEAEAAHKKAIQLDSTNAIPYTNLGSVYNATRRYSEAEQQYKKAIQLDSTNAIAYSNLGVVYTNTSRYAEAEQQYKKAIQLDSTDAISYYNLGIVYTVTRRYSEAEAAYNKAIQLDSTNANAYYNLACLYSLQNQPDKAFEKLEHAIKNGFNDFNGMQQDADLAPLREQKERWDALMQNALVPDTTDAKGWSNLGNLYVQNLRYAEAEPALKKAIALDARFAVPHYLLGKTCFKTNRPEEARREFLKTIELNPQARMARLGMAWLLVAEGKTSEALDWVAQAIEKGGAPFEVLESDEDLAPLRSLPEWKALMKKHFPDQIKE